jgi:hypothetical protein
MESIYFSAKLTACITVQADTTYAENFTVIRKIARNLFKKDTGTESLCSKRLEAS